MKKTKSEQINRLLDAMQEAQAKQSFNIVEDLNGLKDALTYLKTRELKKKIDELVEKYSVTEFAAVHAALIGPSMLTRFDCITICSARTRPTIPLPITCCRRS